MWTNGKGFFYEGDCRVGDRLADESEVLAYQATIKPSKQQMLDSIIVTTQSGKTFDGHAEARNNMMSAIMTADVVGQTESDWKLADNSKAIITLDELREALALSIQAAGEIYLNS